MSVSPLPPVLPTALIPALNQPPTLSVLLIILPLSVQMDVYSQTLASQAPPELPTLVPHSVLTLLKGLLVLLAAFPLLTVICAIAREVALVFAEALAV
jgi:hypothetical protein